MIRLAVLATLTAVICMRVQRGGWSKDQLRKDAAAFLILSALVIAVLKFTVG